MALFAAPLLALIDHAYVPGPILCGITVLSTAVAWRERAAIDRRIMAIALAGLAGGSIVGSGIMALLTGADLSVLFGLLILIMVGLSLGGLPIRATRPALVLGGAAAGILGTMCGVQGPPIALVLQHEAPARLRATLCAFFAAGSLVSLVALAAAGVFTARHLALGLQLLPGVPLGLLAARPIARRIDRRRARLAVLAISTLSAIALLLR